MTCQVEGRVEELRRMQGIRTCTADREVSIGDAVCKGMLVLVRGLYGHDALASRQILSGCTEVRRQSEEGQVVVGVLHHH